MAEGIEGQTAATAGGTARGPIDFGSIFARVKELFLDPHGVWARVRQEPATEHGLYTNYILILAAITPLFSFVVTALFGPRPLVGALFSDLMSYVVTLVSVYLFALVIEKLAPKYNASGDRMNALKLVAYSMTPVWLAGVLLIFGGTVFNVGQFVLILFAVYLFFTGLPVMTDVPEDRKMPYVLVSVGAVVAITLVLFVVMHLLLPDAETPAPGADVNLGSAENR